MLAAEASRSRSPRQRSTFPSGTWLDNAIETSSSEREIEEIEYRPTSTEIAALRHGSEVRDFAHHPSNNPVLPPLESHDGQNDTAEDVAVHDGQDTTGENHTKDEDDDVRRREPSTDALVSRNDAEASMGHQASAEEETQARQEGQPSIFGGHAPTGSDAWGEPPEDNRPTLEINAPRTIRQAQTNLFAAHVNPAAVEAHQSRFEHQNTPRLNIIDRPFVPKTPGDDEEFEASPEDRVNTGLPSARYRRPNNFLSAFSSSTSEGARVRLKLSATYLPRDQYGTLRWRPYPRPGALSGLNREPSGSAGHRSPRYGSGRSSTAEILREIEDERHEATRKRPRNYTNLVHPQAVRGDDFDSTDPSSDPLDMIMHTFYHHAGSREASSRVYQFAMRYIEETIVPRSIGSFDPDSRRRWGGSLPSEWDATELYRRLRVHVGQHCPEARRVAEWIARLPRPSTPPCIRRARAAEAERSSEPGPDPLPQPTPYVSTQPSRGDGGLPTYSGPRILSLSETGGVPVIRRTPNESGTTQGVYPYHDPRGLGRPRAFGGRLRDTVDDNGPKLEIPNTPIGPGHAETSTGQDESRMAGAARRSSSWIESPFGTLVRKLSSFLLRNSDGGSRQEDANPSSPSHSENTPLLPPRNPSRSPPVRDRAHMPLSSSTPRRLFVRGLDTSVSDDEDYTSRVVRARSYGGRHLRTSGVSLGKQRFRGDRNPDRSADDSPISPGTLPLSRRHTSTDQEADERFERETHEAASRIRSDLQLSNYTSHGGSSSAAGPSGSRQMSGPSRSSTQPTEVGDELHSLDEQQLVDLIQKAKRVLHDVRSSATSPVNVPDAVDPTVPSSASPWLDGPSRGEHIISCQRRQVEGRLTCIRRCARNSTSSNLLIAPVARVHTRASVAV